MRKTKHELIGIINFQNHRERHKVDLYCIGERLMPNYGGMLDASLINNRMLIINMQQEGIKFNKVFHYENYNDKAEILHKYLDCCRDKIALFLKNYYKLEEIEILLDTKEIYDEDYCSLPLSEAKADLNQEELREVMKDLASYHRTVTSVRKSINVFFD